VLQRRIQRVRLRVGGPFAREIARGETKCPRNKFIVIVDMLAATATALEQPGQHTVFEL
jgi:hypothetical protein